VLTAGFGCPECATPAFFDWSSHLGFGADVSLHNYLGRLIGEPVATSTLFTGAGVAGIYDVATVPSATQRGFGAAVTLRPLCDARAMGCRVGILQASHMVAGVYRRFGFQEYCKLGLYVWEGKSANQGTG
jgi:hypothetical protein